MGKDKQINRQIHIGVLGIKGLPSKGGGERVAEAIITNAVKYGFKVTVYGKRDYNDNAKISKNIRLISIPYLRGKHFGAFSYGLISTIHAIFFGEYDLIHLHYADYGFIVPLLRMRYKVIGTSHGAEYNRDKWNIFAKTFFKFSESLFIRYTNICTSVSLSLANYYKSKYRKEIIFIPNGIKVNNKYREASIDISKYRLPERYILFSSGRIIPSKGCDILLKAFCQLKIQEHLVIIGKLNDNLKYSRYIHELANRNVVFIDFITDYNILFDLISQCQFFVFPSTYEAMSIMLLEVANLKKGIVCSNISQNKDAIGNNALFFKSQDIQDLTSKLEYAIENQDKMNIIGRKAHRWIVENRNWEILVNKYLELYQCLI